MAWPCSGQTIARKVRDPNYGVRGHRGQAKSLECPACGYCFDQNNEWPGLPAGVKFDPSDQELLEHLVAKVEPDVTKAHPFINEFIPTLNEEDGICYSHPEKIPGVRHDGSSAHFFHRPAKAYTTGTRKRRKIQTGEETGSGMEMRWHKTGKTRPVVENGKQIGCKKIMVLYVSSGKKAKADKTNWVMHQYHLGIQEEEKEGEFVVSKIFYQLQPRQCGLGRKEDGDDSQHVVMEMAEQQAYSSHHSSPSIVSNTNNMLAAPPPPPPPPAPKVEQQAYSYRHSSPSTFSNSNNSLAAPPPPPKTPGPFQRHAVKQHKGLFATITEDVERLQASLSGHSNTVRSSDQGSANYSAQCSPELGEKNTSCSEEKRAFGKELQLDPYHGAAANVVRASFVYSRSDAPSLSMKEISDTLDSEVLKFLSSENLDITLRLQRSSDVSNDKGHDQGGCEREGKDGEKVVHKADFGLENIILDTPPDFLLESFLNSQESTDWLGKKKFWSDSSQKTDDGNFFDFMRDSQSSV